MLLLHARVCIQVLNEFCDNLTSRLNIAFVNHTRRPKNRGVFIATIGIRRLTADQTVFCGSRRIGQRVFIGPETSTTQDERSDDQAKQWPTQLSRTHFQADFLSREFYDTLSVTIAAHESFRYLFFPSLQFHNVFTLLSR